ncbi:MAG: hypothetical protein ACFFCS_20895 [Candidatus Hodarchaeota archaeon]
MTKFKFEREHMPPYHQLRSACGITAVLMLIRPNEDKFISSILHKIGNKLWKSYASLGTLIKDKNSMHQVALAYLLLKLALNEEVQELLDGFNKDDYEYTQEVVWYEMKRRLTRGSHKKAKFLEEQLEKFQEKGEISKGLLKEYATRIKTDRELKLLLAAFGYKVVPFPYSPDGTASINFGLVDHIVESGIIKDDDINNPKGLLLYMFSFLKEHFQDHIVLINTGFHWISAKKIIGDDEEKRMTLLYMDPSHPSKPRKLSFINTKQNIYFFKQDDKLKAIMKEFLEKIL